MSRVRLAALAIAAALLASACGVEPTEGELAADTFRGEATTLTEATIDLDDLEGQDVVLWFWAPW